MTYSSSNSAKNHCECEFTVPIKLNIPITINSLVYINAVPITKQKLPIYIEPDLYLEPEVQAKAPVCYPQEPCEVPQLQQAQQTLPTSN